MDPDIELVPRGAFDGLNLSSDQQIESVLQQVQTADRNKAGKRCSHKTRQLRDEMRSALHAKTVRY